MFKSAANLQVPARTVNHFTVRKFNDAYLASSSSATLGLHLPLSALRKYYQNIMPPAQIY